MKKNYLLSLCFVCMATATGSLYADAQQTTVNQIKYTLNSDGTAYSVTGFEDGIVNVVIESAIEGKPVTTINKEVFKTASGLKSITIPSSITTMGNSIFQNNISLETVIFEDGDKPLAMGGWTFNGCTSIKTVELPGRLASFGANSNFNGCTSLEKVVFNGNCTLADMKQYTFEKTNLKELDLSGLSNVTTFNANCLQNLKSESVKVTLPKAMKPLPKDVLKNCKATEIIFPEGTVEISQQALDAYTYVKLISIPSTITKIGNSAFRNCSSLTEVTFAYNPNLNTSMNYCFEGCSALENIDLSPLPGIKGLVATFKNSGLKKITFSPESQISTFNWDLFNGTPLESIDIPETVTKLGARAFFNCSHLKTINLPKNVSEILSDAFSHEENKTGVQTVIFNQQGGKWPAAIENDNTVSILASDTKAYCYKDVTDIPESVITVSPIETAEYTTYFSTTPVVMPEGVSGSPITGVANAKLLLDFSKYTSGQVIPASVPLLLSAENSGIKLYPVITPDDDSQYSGTNYLVGKETDESLAITDGNVAYVLNEDANASFSFKRHETSAVSIPANKAVLVLPTSLAAENTSFALSDVTTGIDEVATDTTDNDAPVYNLMGIEVNRETLTPGIYISNGKKFIIR